MFTFRIIIFYSACSLFVMSESVKVLNLLSKGVYLFGIYSVYLLLYNTEWIIYTHKHTPSNRSAFNVDLPENDMDTIWISYVIMIIACKYDNCSRTIMV